MTVQKQQHEYRISEDRIKFVVHELSSLRGPLSETARQDLDRALHYFRTALQQEDEICLSLSRGRNVFAAGRKRPHNRDQDDYADRVSMAA